MIDIYFDENYGKLYEKAENGKAIVWEYNGKEGKVRHQFILREIPIKEINGPWFDIVTPYGYGGPIIEEVCAGYEKQDVVQAFYNAFANYCKEKKIVSEFVRFHPLIGNGIDFKSVYNSELNRYTLGTNLKDFADPIQEEFSKSCRKNIRRAISKGITWRVTLSPDNIETFKNIYYSTMDRNNAVEYYYFDDDYFFNCQKYFQKKLLLVEAIFEKQTIAMGLYFVYNSTIHIHLSGTLTEYLYLSPAYILRYAVTLWGKENGYSLIHHGGGRSNSIEDKLFVFKKQFAQNTEFPFYLGKKIWNQEIYDRLCWIKDVDPKTEFFPKYREI